MRLEYVQEPTLPALAWCAEIDLASGRCQLRHGRSVHTEADWFVEGAWDAPFPDGGFWSADYFLGSGGRVVDGGLSFTTASHTLERLHWIRVGVRYLVSNSLVAILAATADELDPKYPYYEADLMSFVRGPERARRSIPTRAGRRVHLLNVATLNMDTGGRVLEERRAPPRSPFTDFVSYRAELARIVTSLARNAGDPARQRTYRPLATVSSGYDSTACAVLAREAGCRDAVTFTSARPGRSQGDDSGERVAAVLGLEVATFDRTDYLRRQDMPEAEFLATGTGGEDVVMCALEPALGGRMLLTGFLGDTVWGMPSDRRRLDEYAMTYPAGASLAEFRLRVDFLHLPLPQLQHALLGRVQAISRRPEMLPWTLGTAYDRPIPRRIAEEAGVPRESFGQEKKAVTQPFYWNESLAEVLSGTSMEHFDSLTGAWPLFPRRRDRWRFAMGRLMHLATLRILWRRQALARRLGWPVPPDLPVSARFRQPLSRNVFGVHWGCATIAGRYLALAPGAPSLSEGAPSLPGTVGDAAGDLEVGNQG